TGNVISNSLIGLRFSIIRTSPSGLAEYIENHLITSDENGLIKVIIGAGSAQLGSIDSIDWSSDNYFLKVEMDITGGENFQTIGTTQLLSVPYALYAKSAGSILNSEGDGSFNHFIGEIYGGGVVFHLWRDAQGNEHGLIVDPVELSNDQPWSNVNQSLIGASAQSSWDGMSNSIAIVGQIGHLDSAADLCFNSNNGGYADWYLPALDELSLLWSNRFDVNRALSGITGSHLLPFNAIYWSSTEAYIDEAWTFHFREGYSNDNGSKFSLFDVRAVRKF
ncbi:MAG: DUF1566 domain-containing protein, partial [Flavobacteriales bacterium]